jgi:hypothetical protein
MWSSHGVGVCCLTDRSKEVSTDSACFSQQCVNEIASCVVLFRPVEWFDGIDFDNASAAKEQIAAEFDGWAPVLTSFITNCDTPPILRTIYQLPDRHRWNRVPGVTLIGDAAHVTLPGGEGANIAMLDGAELGQAIAAHLDDVEAAFASYEAVMFPRSEAEAIAAHKTVELIFGAGAPNGLVDLFNGTLKEEHASYGQL